MGPIGSGWPQIGFKFGFNHIMYLINPNEPDFWSGWAPRVQSRVELGRAPRVQIQAELGRIHLASLVWAENECMVHAALPETVLKLVQQSRSQALRAYSPNMFTVTLFTEQDLECIGALFMGYQNRHLTCYQTGGLFDAYCLSYMKWRGKFTK